MGASKTALARLDRVQARAKKIIGPGYTADLQELAHRRGVSAMCVMHRLVHKSAPRSLHDLCPLRSTRGLRRSARLSTSRTTNIDYFTPPPISFQKSRSFIPLLTTAWNRKLSPDLQSLACLQTFKCRVNSEIGLQDL